MDGEAEDEAGQFDAPRLDGPQQGHGQKAEQALGAAAGADGGHHGIPQPEGGKGGGVVMPTPPSPQEGEDEGAGDDIGRGEDELPKGEEARDGGGGQEPGEQRGVAVGVAGVGPECPPRGVAAAADDEAGGVGEDKVVDVGVLDGRVGVLPRAVDQEPETEEGGDEEEGHGPEEAAEDGHD